MGFGNQEQKMKREPSRWLSISIAAATAAALLSMYLQGLSRLSPAQSAAEPGSSRSTAEPEPSRVLVDAKPPQGQPTARNRGALQEDPSLVEPGCVDIVGSCEKWAQDGECSNNVAFMRTACRASCHICRGGKPLPRSGRSCVDRNSNCATWAAIGECQSNPGFMLGQCPVTCKMCRSETCKDDLPDCAYRCRGGAASNYSKSLHCYYEPELVEKCAWTCGACKEHRFRNPACKREAGVRPAAEPGSISKIFGRIIAEEAGVTVLSEDPYVSRGVEGTCRGGHGSVGREGRQSGAGRQSLTGASAGGDTAGADHRRLPVRRRERRNH